MWLAHYYAVLVFAGRRNGGNPAENMILEAFEALPTWNTKAKLLRRAANERLGTKSSKKLETVLKAIENAQRRRNNAVHARWFTSDSQPVRYIRRPSFLGAAEEWTTADFTGVLQAIDHAHQLLFDYFQEIGPELEQIAGYDTLGQLLREQSAGVSGEPKDSGDT